jgi:hypothetical protein
LGGLGLPVILSKMVGGQVTGSAKRPMLDKQLSRLTPMRTLRGRIETSMVCDLGARVSDSRYDQKHPNQLPSQ